MRRESTEEAVLVDVIGIAKMLRVSPRTARRVAQEPGFPPVVKIRGCTRWWRCDVLEHVRELTGAAEAMTTADS